MQFWPKFVLSSPQIKLFGVLHLQDFMHCYKLSFYAISRKTNETNLRKWQQNLVLGPILESPAQIRAPNFFCGCYLYKKLEVVASYHCMQFHRKLMNQT